MVLAPELLFRFTALIVDAGYNVFVIELSKKDHYIKFFSTSQCNAYIFSMLETLKFHLIMSMTITRYFKNKKMKYMWS